MSGDRYISVPEGEIASLRAQLAEAAKARDAQLAETQRAWNERDGEKRKRLHAETDRDRLAAENARLREALERLAEIADGVGWTANIGTMDEAIEQARAALNGGAK